jgi:hypothetical protein
VDAKLRKVKKVIRPNGDTHVPPRRPFEVEWQELSDRYLPFAMEDSIWRFSRPPSAHDPEQGWKLHLSATIISANLIFKKVAPLLSRSGVLFKGPRSIEELMKINSGLHYGFSQIGKFLTVYPSTTEDAVALARKLYRLTHGFHAPDVPYDVKFKPQGCVYYRYGVFGAAEIVQGKRKVSALRMPDGKLVPDRREPGSAVPSWLTDPFINARQAKRPKPKINNPLMTTFRAYEALSQRGKGGVYRALDLSVAPARLCVLKEGRHHGETDYFGRDGHWRVKHEQHVLASLRQAGLNVPRIYSAFELEGHYYLATEFIEGANLQTIIKRKGKRLSVAQALRYAGQVAQLMKRIHAAGWVWRDCKPLNLIVSTNGLLRPIDFEGACEVFFPDPTPWGTPGYITPKPGKAPNGSRVPDDLYALGATIYQLLTGRFPSAKRFPRLLGAAHRRIPSSVRRITNSLLDPDPQSRPSAVSVFKVLKPFG